MPDLPPPPLVDDRAAEPGWYPDPESPDILRWWDGEAWSATDFTLPGAAGYPWWHPEALRDRFGPLSRAGSLFNVGVCSFIVGGSLSAGFGRDILNLLVLLGMEAVFIGIAIRAWWPRGRQRGEKMS